MGTNNSWAAAHILCIQYPLVSYVHLNSFKHANAHSLRSGILNPFLARDNGDYTNIGLTAKMSIYGFYKDNAYEKNVFWAFVAAYSVMYGMGVWPAKDDRLMIADLLFLFFIIGNSCCVITAIDVQLMLIMLLMSLLVKF